MNARGSTYRGQHFGLLSGEQFRRPRLMARECGGDPDIAGHTGVVHGVLLWSRSRAAETSYNDRAADPSIEPHRQQVYKIAHGAIMEKFRRGVTPSLRGVPRTSEN